MCYAKQLKADKYSIEKFYDANFRDLDYAPRNYENAFDFEYDPIVTAEQPKEIQMYRWGFVPWFEKDVTKVLKPVNTVNCKSEAMYNTPSFRDAARQGKRCLIPATGFFESHWSSVAKKTPRNKIPFKMSAKDQEIFSFAGLYSYWKDKETGREIFSYTLLTTSARGLMTYVHNNPNNPHRMPVIIKKEYERDWLNPTLTEEDVLELCKSMPEDFLVSYPITKEINSTKISTSEKRANANLDAPVEYKPEDLDEPETTEKVTQSKEAKPKKTKGDQSQQSLF